MWSPWESSSSCSRTGETSSARDHSAGWAGPMATGSYPVPYPVFFVAEQETGAAAAVEPSIRAVRGLVVVVADERLVEREGELATLDSLLHAATAGGGRLAVIEGPAGIGKTRLLEAMSANAAGRGMQVFRARGSDLEGEFAFGVVRQLFEQPLVRAGPRRRALARAVSRRTPRRSSPRRASAPAGAEPSSVADPAALSHGLFWLVANLAERTPLVLVVDDAQWADAASLRFLHYLCAAARRATRHGRPGRQTGGVGGWNGAGQPDHGGADGDRAAPASPHRGRDERAGAVRPVGGRRRALLRRVSCGQRRQSAAAARAARGPRP